MTDEAPQPPPIHGRGAASNPKNRFEALEFEPDPEQWDAELPRPKTVYLRDEAKSVLSRNQSPDVGFDVSINPYRGCEHGCSYCYARPTHEFLGFSAGLDFETQILVKENAPDLLRAELGKKNWKPQVIGLSGVTDPYQPVEKKLCITRKCLEVLAELRNPVAIVTKNHLVTRDADLLGGMAEWDGAVVFISLTTLDRELGRTLEPRTASPERRLDAIRKLSAAGVPVGVLVAPVIPGLNDEEVPRLLQAAGEAGARHAGYVVLRLPGAVEPLFQQWLAQHAPSKQERVLRKIRRMRDGELNDGQFNSRMRGTGPLAERIATLFRMGCTRAGIEMRGPRLSKDAFRPPGGKQLRLFE